MSKIYTLLSILMFAFSTQAQVSLTATGGTAGPATYATLKGAFDAVNSGLHRGEIIITINGTTVESATAALNASGTGSSIFSGVTIKPAGGVNAAITGNVAGVLVDFNGADNVIIDGLNAAGNTLTLSNSSTSGNAEVCTIRFINDASGNRIQNATIVGSSTNPASGTIYFSNALATGGSGNDNNIISNCNIADAGGNSAVNGIYSAGTALAGQENSLNSITDNNISNYFHPDFSSAGFLAASGSTDWVISGNRFFQTEPRTFTTGSPHRAIQVISGNNYRVINNVVGFANAAGTGTYSLGGAVTSRFLAIDLAVGSTVASSVQNNTISNFSFVTSNSSSSASGIWCAINVTAGNVNIGTEAGNKIGSSTTTGSISILPAVAGTLTVAITSSSTGQVNISNNQVGGIDVLPTGALSGNLLGIQTQGASGTITIAGNTVGNTTAANMRVGTLGVTTGNGVIRGILNSNAGTVVISGNTIRNLVHNSNNALALFRGIECQQGSATISGNLLNNISAYGTSVSVLTQEGVGILVSSAAPGIVIEQNTISGLAVTNSTTSSGITVSGIYLSSAANGTFISRNRIFDFANSAVSTSSTVPPVICGIYLRDASTAAPIVVVNNMLSLGSNQSSNTAVIGIWNQVATAANYTERLLYNTINITGNVSSGAQPSFGFYRGDFTSTAFTTPNIELKNNIITNSRAGGLGKHYAIANGYPSATSNAAGWQANSSDYNILNAATNTIGYWSGDKTFAAWQAATSGDAHSYTGLPVAYVNPLSDLHIIPSLGAAFDNKGTPLPGISIDIDNELRNTLTPDIGADEFQSAPLAITIEYFRGEKRVRENLLSWKATCSSNSIVFEVEQSLNGTDFRKVGSIAASQERCAQPFDFVIPEPPSAKNYYRLKMIEADGKIIYTNILSITNLRSQVEITKLVPSVISHQTMVSVFAPTAQTATMIVSDQKGTTISTRTIQLQQGSNQLSINLNNLPRGVYQLTIAVPGIATSARMVKL